MRCNADIHDSKYLEVLFGSCVCKRTEASKWIKSEMQQLKVNIHSNVSSIRRDADSCSTIGYTKKVGKGNRYILNAICTDLNIGLPAEIEARQKQYEYYRDLLLTFAETGSTLM